MGRHFELHLGLNEMGYGRTTVGLTLACGSTIIAEPPDSYGLLGVVQALHADYVTVHSTRLPHHAFDTMSDFQNPEPTAAPIWVALLRGMAQTALKPSSACAAQCADTPLFHWASYLRLPLPCASPMMNLLSQTPTAHDPNSANWFNPNAAWSGRPGPRVLFGLLRSPRDREPKNSDACPLAATL